MQAFNTSFQLDLQPATDILSSGAVIEVTSAVDGSITTRPLRFNDAFMYKGRVQIPAENKKWRDVGWARITFHTE
jgi:hypothetical protein